MNKLIMLLILSLIGIGFYFQWNNALGASIGILWGFLNVYCIKQLMSRLLITSQRSYWKILGVSLIKFPVLYLIGYELLLLPYFSPWSLLIGFSLALAVITQSWFWQSLTFMTQASE